MRHRVPQVVLALATCLPALAVAQERAGSWELSIGGGATYLDRQIVDVITLTSPTRRLVPGAALRLGYNLGRSWNLSVGMFAGYTSPATLLQPFGAITWTPNINASTSPFLTVGAGVTNVSWKSDTSSFSFSSQYTVHAGIGLLQTLGRRIALRLEVRELYEKYADTTYFSRASFYPTATLGLSFFFGGRRADVATVAAAPRAAAPVPEAAAPVAAPAAPPGLTLGIAPSAYTLTALGFAVQLAVTAQDADNNVIATPEITWSSSNATAVSVSASGLATAVRNGTATITASAGGGGQTATATVTVRQAVATVLVTPPAATITAAGGTIRFTVQASDANGWPVTGKVITWTDSAPSVATLGARGVATAVGNGTAKITATVEGVTGAATLTVALPAAPGPAVPAPGAIALPEVGATLVLRNLIFRPNSAVLPAEAHTDLDAVAQAMQAIPTARWEIGGYTSNMGNPARNELLSRRRALAVRAYLARQGVPATRLVAVGYGSQNPVASNATAAGRRQNMRVEIKRLR